MIPAEKSDAVAHGLLQAFGLTAFEDISRITLGQTSSLVFRIVVRGSPYLLKIITRAEDPTRHYTSMRAAAEIGIAPAVRYANSQDKVSITDFVEAQPLSRSDALSRLPQLLRRLHALPPFDTAPFNTTCTFLLDKSPARDKFPALDAYLDKFLSSNTLPEPAAREFLARHAELIAAYPYRDGELVASHNDLFKPDNILYDGHRVWLVDWEAAFLNDRYADLAVVANQVVTNEAEESIFLREYFGAPPDDYQRARFHLMQQVSHLFYTMAFLTIGAHGTTADWTTDVPEFHDYHQRIWAGEIDLGDKHVKTVLGRVHWERFLHNARQPRYTESLNIVQRN